MVSSLVVEFDERRHQLLFVDANHPDAVLDRTIPRIRLHQFACRCARWVGVDVWRAKATIMTHIHGIRNILALVAWKLVEK